MSGFGKRDYMVERPAVPEERNSLSFGQGVVAGVCAMIVVAGAAVVALSYIGLQEPRQNRSPEEMAAVLQNADPARIPTRPIQYGSLPPFDDLTTSLSEKLDCGTLTPAQVGLGRLWGCDLGPTRTAKIFVNEGEDGAVKNVKVMWNDAFKDAPLGFDPDRPTALSLAALVAETIGASTDQYQSAIGGISSRRLDAPDGLSAHYSYSRGPSVAERMITVTNFAERRPSSPPVAARSSGGMSDAQFERAAKQAIQTFGYWCEGRVRVDLRPFSSTVNKQVYRAFCDDRSMNATYDIVNDRGRISVTGASW